MKHSVTKIDASISALNSSRDLYNRDEELFERYIDLLLQWNEKINLVSRTVSRETVREHVVHSLLPLSLNLLAGYRQWIDAGSGGGMPGIPISISNRELNVVLNDNVKKKMMAVDDIVSTMGLPNISTIDRSISLVDLKMGTGIISKHAFKIPKLIQLLKGKPWELIILWKGVKDVEQELTETKGSLNAKIIRFDFGSGEPFYEGKGLVILQK